MKIENLYQIENLYIEQFSQKDEKQQMIYYTDDNLPSMYSHNFTLIKENQNILSILRKELCRCKKENKSFLRIETYFKIKH